MKKEYTICYEVKGFGDVVNLQPYTLKRFTTVEAAEIAIEHLLSTDIVNQKYSIVPCYSKN